jgi:hypothetical protein
MELNRFVSTIVRQTTVLIARLSTSQGTRSPLARVADQVFLGLVNELERQGVGKKVVADMFGLALRSYQLKVQRLQESASETGVTLWSAVKRFVDQRGAISRKQILKRFERDGEASVRSVLADLVDSGLLSRSGRGDESMYRTIPSDEFTLPAGAEASDARAALVCLIICRDGPIGRDALEKATGIAPRDLEATLADLSADGRIQQSDDGDGVHFSADRCLVPLGDDAGWEAALLDHHQAVLNAIGAKVCAGVRSSSMRDETGGATFNFEVWPGHPKEAEIRGLLARLRREAAELWEENSSYNSRVERPEEGRYNIAFYLGQHNKHETIGEEEDSEYE